MRKAKRESLLSFRDLGGKLFRLLVGRNDAAIGGRERRDLESFP